MILGRNCCRRDFYKKIARRQKNFDDIRQKSPVGENFDKLYI